MKIIMKSQYELVLRAVEDAFNEACDTDNHELIETLDEALTTLRNLKDLGSV